jgi:hypothetical protein
VPGPPKEDLQYSTDFVLLSSANPPLGVGSIKVGNVGAHAAGQVRVVIEFPKGVDLKDQRFQLSSGEAGLYEKLPSADNTVSALVDQI